MTAPERELTGTWLTMLSRRCHSQFARHNMTVRRSSTVHSVAWVAGFGGIEFPTPACRVGVTGWDLDALHPVSERVTCGRCLRSAQARAAEPDIPLPRGGQLELPLL